MPDFSVFTSLTSLAAFLVCAVVYMVLHELVHGACMKVFGAKKVRFGFTGLYAFAGSIEYFKKAAYIVVALAPLVVWGRGVPGAESCHGNEVFLVHLPAAAGQRFGRGRRSVCVFPFFAHAEGHSGAGHRRFHNSFRSKPIR